MKKYIFLFTALVFATQADAQTRSIKFTEGKWDEIVAQAAKENKYIFVDCFTTWCGPCKWLAKNIFTKDEVADFYNNKFISVEIDMEKGEGIELAKKWAVRGYPSLIFCDPKGEVQHRSCGVEYTDEFYKKFIELGKNALDPAMQLGAMKKSVESGKADSKQYAEYVLLLSRSCVDHEPVMKTYFATQKDADLIKRYNWDLIYNGVQDHDSREFKYLLAHRAEFEKAYTPDSVSQKIMWVYMYALRSTVDDSVRYAAMKQEVKTSGIKDADRILLQSDMNLFRKKKDWPDYAKAATAYVNKYSADDPSTLNSVAWDFYENVSDKTMLQNAERWAKHAVELHGDYANTDTYAAVLYKEGKLEDAKKQAEAAIELAKQEKTDYKSTQQLLDKMNGVK